MRKLSSAILMLFISCNAPKYLKTLNGSKSYDLDGVIVKYEWRLVIGSKAKIFKPLAMVTFVEIGKGIHTFELTVTDDRGATDKDTVLVKI